MRSPRPSPRATTWRFDGSEALDFCHRETLRMLAKLESLVDRLDVEGADGVARSEAAGIVQHFSSTVAEHHADEELHVFPLLAADAGPDVHQALLRLSQDHAWMEADWRELRPMLDGVACGLGWVDVDLLRAASEVFCALAREHILLEEGLIYPQFRHRLTDAGRLRMNDEMRARRQAARAAHPRRA